MSCASASAKKSATSGVKPARGADCTSDRPEIAASSSEGPSACEFLGKSVGIPEIEIERLFRFDHLLEQAGFGPILDVADRERSDADRFRSRCRRCIVVHPSALD